MEARVSISEVKVALTSIFDAIKKGAGVQEANDAVMIDLENDIGVTSVAPSQIIKLKNVEGGTIECYLRETNEDPNSARVDLYLGKHNGKRFYWNSKLDDFYTVALPDLEDDDKVVICPDKERYTPYVRGERVSLDCGDFVAVFLRGLGEDVEEVVTRITVLLDRFDTPVPKKSKGEDWNTHASYHWQALNNGQQRMLAGQALRHACKTNEELVSYIKGLPHLEPKKAEKKVTRDLPKKVKRNTKKK